VFLVQNGHAQSLFSELSYQRNNAVSLNDFASFLVMTLLVLPHPEHLSHLTLAHDVKRRFYLFLIKVQLRCHVVEEVQPVHDGKVEKAVEEHLIVHFNQDPIVVRIVLANMLSSECDVLGRYSPPVTIGKPNVLLCGLSAVVRGLFDLRVIQEVRATHQLHKGD
jgi:hypothetical protein